MSSHAQDVQYYPPGSLFAEKYLLDIDAILRPWRSEVIREAAIRLNTLKVSPILRTHYDPDQAARGADDRQIAGWLQLDKDSADSMDNKWTYLNDSELFNFGDHWERIFELVPELTYLTFSEDETIRPKFPQRNSEISYLQDTLRYFKENLEAWKDKTPKNGARIRIK
ncbi:uncharacterized protein N7483_004621 [Penicillium malachiteum]|uniref:uncharacterized protein n=1 Tax=Penicillium malachiteum TaxID=1324776 RepID=UPI0025482204|nr:uncharacterized protein N7483_004621 [Penicillium malachiteum]KAJ5730113.1 hypothetical protein N7483_004621 [Penicillium malachiteum]